MPRSWVYFLAPASIGGALLTTSLVEAWLIWQRKAPITVELRQNAFLKPAWAVALTASVVFGAGVLLGHLVRGEKYAAESA